MIGDARPPVYIHNKKNRPRVAYLRSIAEEAGSCCLLLSSISLLVRNTPADAPRMVASARVLEVRPSVRDVYPEPNGKYEDCFLRHSTMLSAGLLQGLLFPAWEPKIINTTW